MSARPEHRAELVFYTFLVAFVALTTAFGLHDACTPEAEAGLLAGTPRADYCEAIDSAHPWIALTLGPTLLMLGLGWPLRRRLWALALLVLAICGLLIFDPLHAYGLRSESSAF